MSYLIPDDPVIHHIEMTGMPPWEKEQKPPICPICEKECDTFYRGFEGDIIGCENCVTAYDAWEAINYDV